MQFPLGIGLIRNTEELLTCLFSYAFNAHKHFNIQVNISVQINTVEAHRPNDSAGNCPEKNYVFRNCRREGIEGKEEL